MPGYKYLGETGKEFNVRQRMNILQEEYEKLRDDIRKLQAAQAKLSQRVRQVERGRVAIRTRREVELETREPGHPFYRISSEQWKRALN